MKTDPTVLPTSTFMYYDVSAKNKKEAIKFMKGYSFKETSVKSSSKQNGVYIFNTNEG